MSYAPANIVVNETDRSNWLVAVISDDTFKYYKTLSRLTYILPSRNGVHSSIIRGQHEKKQFTKEELEKWRGVEIQYEHDGIIWTNGRAYWINAYSVAANSIRCLMGLDPVNNFHITIGTSKQLSRIKHEARIV